ncbi:MAG TPA: hypothetical protein VLF18_09625 [Tahibacter sp.]|uniref:hypothetical protein n=1 Tax=Tahibacter sp. TaxID=2056211 RepID=UPI002C61671A|nr:hypothetical protein [Tahibacter sp.]HSX60444.1 hypothetical protein [Tahibacter sp.]
MKRLALLATTLIFAALTPAIAAKETSPRFVDIEKQQQFDDQAMAIRQEMKPGGRFEFVTAEERHSVEAELDRIAALLRKRQGGELDDDDRLDIYAAQETANAILTQRDGRRLICEFSAPTGSNRKVKQCATYADRMRAHKETRNYLRETFGKSPSAGEKIDGL